MSNKIQRIKKSAQSILLIIGASCAAHNALADSALTSDSPALNKANVIYTYDEMFSFNVSDYLNNNAPHLLPYAEAISHYAAVSTTSPKVLLTLIEQQSGLLTTHDTTPEKVALAFGKLSDKYGFNQQLEDIAGRINLALYQTPGYTESITNPSLPDNLAARKIIQSIFSAEKNFAFEQSIAVNEINHFNKIYRQLFPQISNPMEEATNSNTTAVPPSNFLQLPFPIGEAWSNGGSHTFTGSGAYPQSSLDFNDGGVWGGNIDHLWVVASAAGRVVVHSSCNVEVVHDNGWSTAYYHLDNVQVQTGDVIGINTPIANYANNRSQALCEGGSSSGPHVHFSLKKDAQYFDLDGVALSGYVVSTGNDSYDSDCNRFWLKKEGEAKKCAWSQVYNDGVGGPIEDPETLENNVPKTGLSGTAKQQLFYTMEVPANAKDLSFKTSGGSGDADLYVRYGSKPTLESYDCNSTTSTSNEVCDISQVQAGTYHVMVEAWSAISGVTLVASYTGSDSDDRVLENGVAKENLSESQGTDVLYTFNVPEGATDIQFNMSGGSGDADMYVKFNSAPTESSYDCRPYAQGNNESCEGAQMGGVYYVLIKAFSSYSGVKLVASFVPPIGDAELIDRTETIDVLDYNQWGHFTETLAPGYASLTVTISGGQGDADLYVRHGSQSTFQQYDCRPYLNGNDEVCTIELPDSGTWYFDLYGYGKRGAAELMLNISAIPEK